MTAQTRDRQLDVLEVTSPSLADKQRATGLMTTARHQAARLREVPPEERFTAYQRAMRQLVFVEEGARLTPTQYDDAEAERVLAGFLGKCAELAAVGAD